MFGMRGRNKSKYTFVATKVYETVEGKRIFKSLNQNEDFG